MLAFYLWFVVTIFSGDVRDAVSNAPVAGAEISVIGGFNSVRSDSAGRFRIDASEGARVRVTHPAYATVEFALGRDSTITIHLTPLTRMLEGVTVRAIRGSMAPVAAPIAQSTLSAAQLGERYSGQEVPFLLAHVPAITTYSDAGAYSNYTYFRIRGLDQTRVNITLDGIPLNDAEDQGVFFSNFPDFGNSIQSVQVQRGVGTSSLGTAAYAGSVNFESVALANVPQRGELQVSRGSFHTTRGSAEWQDSWGAGGRFAAYGRLSWQETDGYRHNSGNRATGAFASVGYYGERTVAKLTALTGVSRNQLSYLAVPEDELAVDPRSNPLDDSDRFWQQVTGLTVNRQLGSGHTVGATLYNVAAGGDYDVTFDGTVYNFNLRSSVSGAIGSYAARWGRASVILGGHANTYYRDHFMFIRPETRRREYSNRGDKDEASLFAKTSIETGRATWFGDVQLRRAWYAYTPDHAADIPGEDIAWGFVNPKVGVTLRLSPRVSAYASYGSNGREPTRNDMFAGFDNLDTTNAAFVGPFDRVRPERVRDAEVGAEYRQQSAWIAANAFDMRFRNEITPIGELSYLGLPLRKNVRSSYRQGLELEGGVRVAEPVTLSLNATLMRARIAEYTDDASGTTYHDVEPLLTPGFTSNQRVSFRLGTGARLHLDGRYVGSSFLTNTGDERFTLPAAFTADAALQLTLRSHEVLLQVRNVADRRTYAAGYSDGSASYFYVQPPRNFMITVRLGVGSDD